MKYEIIATIICLILLLIAVEFGFKEYKHDVVRVTSITEVNDTTIYHLANGIDYIDGHLKARPGQNIVVVTEIGFLTGYIWNIYPHYAYRANYSSIDWLLEAKPDRIISQTEING